MLMLGQNSSSRRVKLVSAFCDSNSEHFLATKQRQTRTEREATYLKNLATFKLGFTAAAAELVISLTCREFHLGQLKHSQPHYDIRRKQKMN